MTSPTEKTDTVRRTVMSHNAETGDLVCYLPDGKEVLRVVVMDTDTAHSISEAVQTAYRTGHRTGHLLGRLHLQAHLEMTMDTYNRS